jgi:L-lactate utilization protein LutC
MSARDELFFRLKKQGRPVPSGQELASQLDEIFEKLPENVDGLPLLERFLSRLEEAGGETSVHDSWADLAVWMQAELQRSGARSVLLASHEEFDQALATQLEGAGVVVHRLPAGSSPAEREAFTAVAASADFGIGRAEAGFADSGAIAVAASRKESRSLSLLPETHVAVLREEDIHPEIGAFAATMTAMLRSDRTSAFTLVAGPSKTADIEKVLVTGVHGPRRFLVAVLRTGAAPR